MLHVEDLIRKIEHSLHKGFINQNTAVSTQFKPKLLTNHAHENVLSTLLQELKTCKTFLFSVAFITEGGLATLKTILKDLHTKGIKGRILTSTFLQFNQPKMFKELLKLENVEVRLTDIKGFHSKGYIFEHQDYYSLIVGSSNLTDSALKANFEWNVFLTSLQEGEVINHFKNQFELAWENALPLSEDWIANYSITYVKPDFKNTIVAAPPLYQTNKLKDALTVHPNKMQIDALAQLKALRATGAQKGLIISATGTGKTFLSAFDVRNYSPKRMLFIVHREQILKKAMQDYKLILGGNEEDFGILSGNLKNYHAKYLFATVQTISSLRHLEQFDPNDFDYILIDEVHRSGASSYQTIINYFTPNFLLGMTATPERTDGFNIYELFDYNIAYEIRLQAALEEDMLCPFHYFGVVDYEKDGITIEETTDLRVLVSEERVNHILEKVDYYGYSGEKVRGLIFCSSVAEAKDLSKILDSRGIKNVALSGSDDQITREKAVEQLNNCEINYILTVDIFNEGVDIPFLNQIIMLRQTQSSIIFIQQLGRGLRKHNEKEYVTIIDFIGNYKNNYLIPIALSDDKSLNKDNVRRKTVNTDYIKGVSSINFEEIAKKRIFEAINNTNLSTSKNLKEAFTELKNRTNRIPYLYDFILQDTLDPEVIINFAGTYYEFLLKMKEDIITLSSYEQKVLRMISNEFINGKRIHEIILLELLLKDALVSKVDFINALIKEKTYYDEQTIESVNRIFSLDFHVQNDKKKYGEKPIIELINDMYSFNEEILTSLKNEYFVDFIKDVLKCARSKNKDYDSSKSLTIYKKYSRRDVCRLLNWTNDISSTIYGYRTRSNATPLFVTYHKHEDVETSLAYGDEFISPEIFKWYSRNRLTTESKEVKEILDHRVTGNEIHLFIKKENGEGSDFYYLGQTEVDPSNVENTTMSDKNGKTLSVVTMNMILEKPVDNDIYHYLVEE